MSKLVLPGSIFAVLMAVAAPPAFAQKIYWAGPDNISRADLDGSNVQTLLQPGQLPTAIALDLLNQKVYWTELLNGGLKRANLDGSIVEPLAYGVHTASLEVDPPGGKLYWLEDQSGRIRCSNLDGDSAEDVVVDLFNPQGFDLDAEDGWMYWDSDGSIWRAHLDGTGRELVIYSSGSVNDIAVDSNAGLIYWIRNSFIWRANLDGGAGESLISPGGKDLVVSQRIYWADASHILSAGLDGSDPEVLIRTPVRGIALDLRECSGHGQRVNGQCVCDALWEGDNCGCYTGGCLNDCSGRGECVCGICHCDNGWGGEDCTCSTICPEDCSGHGSCACGSCECDPQYEGDDCSCFIGGCPNACSGHGTCDCGQCICDPGWDGPECACEPQDCPNDCSGHGSCACGVCDCDPGWITEDCSVLTQSPARVFMAPDGLQQTAAPMGPTTYLTPAGTTIPLKVWMEDVTPGKRQFGGYQLIMPWNARALPGATGTVAYVNLEAPPGQFGGNSILLDVSRPDWIFAGTFTLPIFYNETHDIIIGLIYLTFFGSFVDPTDPGGIHYLCEFELSVSPDASGVFEYEFNLKPNRPPLAILYNAFGGPYPVDEFQPLRLIIGQTQPLSSEPPHQGIDPRQGSADGPEGGATLELIYNGAAPDAFMKHFDVEVSTGQPPQIVDLGIQGSSVKLTFDRPFPGGQCTTIRHLPSDWRTTIRSLPGDVNGDGVASPIDIITLVDHFNGVKQPALKIWQCDINLSGECEPRDILALVDLLNGAGVQESWNGAEAPQCP